MSARLKRTEPFDILYQMPALLINKQKEVFFEIDTQPFRILALRQIQTDEIKARMTFKLRHSAAHDFSRRAGRYAKRAVCLFKFIKTDQAQSILCP